MSELWPTGNYTGNLVEWEVGEAKTGTPQVVLVFEVDNSRRTVFLALSDAAWQYTEDKLRLMGFNGDFENPDFAKPDGVPLYCKHDTYQGKTGEKWDVSTGMNVTPAKADVRKTLTRRWASQNAKPSRPSTSAPPARSAPPPAETTRSAPPPADDDAAPSSTFEEITDKNACWSYWEDIFKGAVDVGHWQEVIREVANGRKESAFTADDWRAVAKKAVPF